MKNRNARDLAEAKDRVSRAKRYAQMFPKFIHEDDLKFQTLAYQLEQVKRFNAPCAPPKP